MRTRLSRFQRGHEDGKFLSPPCSLPWFRQHSQSSTQEAGRETSPVSLYRLLCRVCVLHAYLRLNGSKEPLLRIWTRGNLFTGRVFANTCAFWCLFFGVTVNSYPYSNMVLSRHPPLVFTAFCIKCEMSAACCINNPNYVFYSSWSVYLSRIWKQQSFLLAMTWTPVSETPRPAQSAEKIPNSNVPRFRRPHLRNSSQKQRPVLIRQGAANSVLIISGIRLSSCLAVYAFIALACVCACVCKCVRARIRFSVMAVGNFVVIVRQWRITLQ